MSCVAESGWAPDLCGIDRSEVLDDVDPTVDLDLTTSAADVAFLDLADLMCTDTWCSFVQGGRLVFRDPTHLTATYVASLEPELERRLAPALGWW